ncbi:DUF2656 domain-containing protein [Nostocaceae cyanobacterium CENA357]|uniref:DUF2656 domain-containing protein n=2 Tax=Atlanticothrix TaxID=2840441 RepID=A0A8J7HDV1_9CYAN|nr:DUF2656 domain-containing protein [Atlanticothrix silvestris CENA357]
MLLSHNFDVSTDIVPVLSREEFTEVFQEGLIAHKNIKCRQVNNPHWIVEILFSPEEFLPQQVAELCADVLAQKRQAQGSSIPEILVLGGIKTTPPTSNSPDALQPGNWGVDVVETLASEAFLQAIAWDATIAQKPADSIFKVELKHKELGARS